jgi:hypothetical protein
MKYGMVTQNMGDLGNLRGQTLRKAWHTGGNPPHGTADFYPLFVEVGKVAMSAPTTFSLTGWMQRTNRRIIFR